MYLILSHLCGLIYKGHILKKRETNYFCRVPINHWLLLENRDVCLICEQYTCRDSVHIIKKRLRKKQQMLCSQQSWTIYSTWLRIRFDTKSVYWRGVACTNQNMSDRHKKKIVPPVFSCGRRFRHAAINSALLSKYCFRGRSSLPR